MIRSPAPKGSWIIRYSKILEMAGRSRESIAAIDGLPLGLAPQQQFRAVNADTGKRQSLIAFRSQDAIFHNAAKAGAWGSHEGSILLWGLILAGYLTVRTGERKAKVPRGSL